MTDLYVLDHFKYCPKCGSQNLSRPKEIVVVCGDCDFTLYFNPTSSAATFIEDDAGKLLVIKRAREPSKGKFGLPGGFIDPGETAEQCAIREAKEEVNLDLQKIEYLGSWPNEYVHKSVMYPVLDTYFVGHVDSFEEMNGDPSEVTTIEYVDPGTVPAEQWAFPSLKKAVRKYLETRSR